MPGLSRELSYCSTSSGALSTVSLRRPKLMAPLRSYHPTNNRASLSVTPCFPSRSASHGGGHDTREVEAGGACGYCCCCGCVGLLLLLLLLSPSAVDVPHPQPAPAHASRSPYSYRSSTKLLLPLMIFPWYSPAPPPPLRAINSSARTRPLSLSRKVNFSKFIISTPASYREH